MDKERQKEELRDRYRHPGFSPSVKVEVAQWDEGARIIRLTRRSKKLFAAFVGQRNRAGTTEGCGELEICPVVMSGYSLSSICAV